MNTCCDQRGRRSDGDPRGWALPVAAVLVAAIALAGNHSSAQAPPGQGAASPSADLALVPANALGFLHVRVAELWASDVGKAIRQQQGQQLNTAQQQLEKTLGVALADIERATLVLLAPGEDPIVTILTTSKPYTRAKVLQALAPDPQEHKVQNKVYYDSKTGEGEAVHFADDRTFIFGSADNVVQALGAPKGQGALSHALGVAAQKHHAVFGVQIPDEAAAPLKANLPSDFSRQPLEAAIAQSLKPLLEMRSAALTLDLARESDLKAQLVFADETKAKEAVLPAKDALTLLRMLMVPLKHQVGQQKDIPNLVPFLQQLEQALRSASVEQKGSAIHVGLRVPTEPESLASATSGLIEATAKVRLAANRMRSGNNLKQIAIAMHNYHATYNKFPPYAICTPDGKPLLSWRVAILPYVEHDNLYQQFKLNEPWDSEHNKKLLTAMPNVYAPVAGPNKQGHLTYYRVFVGNGALFEGTDGPQLQGILDGTSNTLFAVEAGEAVPWTKPDELAYAADQPLPRLGGLFADGFNAAFCDGSVRFLPKTIDEQTLRAIITRAGGEPVMLPE